MSVNAGSAMGSVSFRRIVDVPFETCLAALDSRQRTGHGGELRFGRNQLLGPMEHDRDSGTRRMEVRLARGPLRPLVRMRLDIDRWSSSYCLGAHPLRARPAYRGLLPRRASPA